MIYLQDFCTDPNTGRDAVLRGYAAVYNVPSSCTFEDGRHELIARGAFDKALAGSVPTLVFDHLTFLGSSVRLWSDDVGLAFCADKIKYNPENDRIVRMIARGMCGCSFKAIWTNQARQVEEVLGVDEPMYVIREVQSILDISPCKGPGAYDGAAVWLASATPGRLPMPAFRLIHQWHKNAPEAVITTR